MSGRGPLPQRGKSRHHGHRAADGGHYGGTRHIRPYSQNNPPTIGGDYPSGPSNIPRPYQPDYGRKQWRGAGPYPVNFQTQLRTLADEAEHLMYLRKLDEARELVGLVRDEPKSSFQWGEWGNPTSMTTGLPGLTPAEIDKIKADRERELAYSRLPHRPERSWNWISGRPMESRGREQSRGVVVGRMDGENDGLGRWNEDGENSGKRAWSGERNMNSLRDDCQRSSKSHPPPLSAGPASSASPFSSRQASLKRKLLEDSTNLIGFPSSLKQTSHAYFPGTMPAGRHGFEELFSDQTRRELAMSQENLDGSLEITDENAQMDGFDRCDQEAIEEEKGPDRTTNVAPEVSDDVSMAVDEDFEQTNGELAVLASKLTVLSIKSNPEILSFTTSGPSISLLSSHIPTQFSDEIFSNRILYHAVQRLTAQPARWLSQSIHMFPSCAESNDVFNLARKLYETGLVGGRSGCIWIPEKIAVLRQRISIRRDDEERTQDLGDLPVGELLLETLQLFGVSPLNQFLMRPMFCQPHDRIVDLMAMRDAAEKERKFRVKLQKQRLAVAAEVVAGDGRPYTVFCAACEVWAKLDKEPPTPLSGLDAGLLWRIRRRLGEEKEVLENLRFCGEHAGAIIGRDFCPLCMRINETGSRHENFELGGMYCSGLNDNERHFFHACCASENSDVLTCPHCGNSNRRFMRGWEPVEVDWRLKSPLTGGRAIFAGNKLHRTAGLCQDQIKTHNLSQDITVAVWSPVENLKRSFALRDQSGRNVLPKNGRGRGRGGPAKSRLRKPCAERSQEVVPWKKCFIPNLQHFFRQNSLVPSSTDLLKKYAAPLMSLSGERSGCLCRSECVPDICPCARWMKPEMHYNSVDGTLRFRRQPKWNFIRECSELCMCCMDKCCNRVTQMPSKVVTVMTETEDGWCLKTAHRVKRGQFICRIGGTLAEHITETDSIRPDTFFLPKFGLWPDKKRSLVLENVCGLAKDFCKLDGKQATVMPVVILQAPVSMLLNIPQQLVIPTVAFFATRNLGANSILSYADDFRDVNVHCPQTCRLTDDAVCETPINSHSLVYERREPVMSCWIRSRMLLNRTPRRDCWFFL